MKASLSQFLRGEQPAYEPFKARVLGTGPTRITEDNKACLSFPDFLNSEASEQVKEAAAGTVELNIEKWHLEPLSNPNTQDPLVRLVPSNYTLKKVGPKFRAKASLPDLLLLPEIE